MDNTTEYIRKSPAVLALKVVVVEVVTELTYLILHTLINTINAHSVSINVLGINAAINVLMSVAALALFVIVLASWAAEGTYIKTDELEYKHGVLRSRSNSYPYANMQRIRVDQGVIGKFLTLVQ